MYNICLLYMFIFKSSYFHLSEIYFLEKKKKQEGYWDDFTSVPEGRQFRSSSGLQNPEGSREENSDSVLTNF